MKRITLILISLLMLIALTACNNKETASNKYKDAVVIELNNDKATINNQDIQEFDYVWHVDPTLAHNEVKNAPAEYYTGQKPSEDIKVYIDHELYYYPKLDLTKYTKVNYDGENEWVYYYEDGVNNDYIFATLPCFENSFEPINTMMFTEEEAASNKVLHIKEAGTYVLQGKWDGQINVDLGEESFTDESQKVTIILNGVDINCSVAPAIIFENAYECDNTWEEKENNGVVDTTNAGVNVIISDDSENNISGKNIYRMLKTKYKDEESKDLIKVQKKQRKIDAPFYSYVSINVDGEDKGNGLLNITSSFEGLDTELHLTFNGGIINVNSEDDGINVNEDNVSVVTFNGGEITLNAANGAEGDGVDSNGYVVINGSTLNINNVRMPDNQIDSENGITYKKGSIYIDGKLEEIEEGIYNEIGNSFGGQGFGQIPFVGDFDLKEFKEKVANLPDDATMQDVLELFGMNMNPDNRMGFGNEPRAEMPNNMEPGGRIGEPPENMPNNTGPFDNKPQNNGNIQNYTEKR